MSVSLSASTKANFSCLLGDYSLTFSGMIISVTWADTKVCGSFSATIGLFGLFLLYNLNQIPTAPSMTISTMTAIIIPIQALLFDWSFVP